MGHLQPPQNVAAIALAWGIYNSAPASGGGGGGGGGGACEISGISFSRSGRRLWIGTDRGLCVAELDGAAAGGGRAYGSVAPF